MLFLAGVLIAYLGITRLVVQTGVFYLTTPVVSQAMTMMTLGTSAISPTGLAALGLTYSFFGDVQSIFMPSAAHAAKLQHSLRIARRGFVLAIALAVVLSFAVSLTNLIAMAYEQGASNFNSWIFRVSSGAGVMAFGDVMAKIKAPADFHAQKLGFFRHRRSGDVRFDVYAVSLSVVAPAPGGLGYLCDLDGAESSSGDLCGVGGQESDYALWRY